MFGMDSMSAAVKPIGRRTEFTGILKAFSIRFSMLAGALFTAVIQSSSASVGILQSALRDRSGKLRRGNSDYFRTEYRYLCNCSVIRYRSKEKCQKGSYGTFVF